MNKSDVIHKELELYQDILNYQMTGLASPELQYTKYQIKELNNKCDRLYVTYYKQLEKERITNMNSKKKKPKSNIKVCIIQLITIIAMIIYLYLILK